MCVPTGVFSLTVIPPPPEINVTLKSDSSVVLNCTYRLQPNEYIVLVYIRKRTSSGGYNDLVRYTERSSQYTPSGEYLRNRSEIYGFDNGSAVLVIDDVRCEDDGQYQCFLDYTSNEKPAKNLQNTTVYIHGKIV